MKRVLSSVAVAAALALAPAAGFAADEKAAEKLMRDSNCTKCHAVSKKKEGPSYKEVAEKYRGKPDAEAKLTTHVTTAPTVKVDGKEEKHEQLKADPAEVKNLVQWILSLQ